jgi:hypothetical protein
MLLGIVFAIPLAKRPPLPHPRLLPLLFGVFASAPPQKEGLLQPEAKWDCSQMRRAAFETLADGAQMDSLLSEMLVLLLVRCLSCLQDTHGAGHPLG